jgi:pimeloyl-ACP methyl ester carboxylesterase
MRERSLNLQHDKGELKIRYLESDNNNMEDMQRCVVFIHGLGSSADRWLDIPDALSLYFHTIALDLPGFGGSDKPTDVNYTIEEFSDIVRRFMHKVGIIEREHSSNKARAIMLVGHSLGGYIAASIAATDDSDFLDKLVLVDSSGNLEKPTPILEEYLDAAINSSKEKTRKVFEQMVANPLLISDVFVQGFIDRIDKPGAKYAFECSLRNSANTQVGIQNLNKIGEKGIRTLIIWGMYDRVIPLQHSEIFRDAIQDSSVVVIPQAGHAPFAEKPALVCEYLHRFLADK